MTENADCECREKQIAHLGIWVVITYWYLDNELMLNQRIHWTDGSHRLKIIRII